MKTASSPCVQCQLQGATQVKNGGSALHAEKLLCPNQQASVASRLHRLRQLLP